MPRKLTFAVVHGFYSYQRQVQWMGDWLEANDFSGITGLLRHFEVSEKVLCVTEDKCKYAFGALTASLYLVVIRKI